MMAGGLSCLCAAVRRAYLCITKGIQIMKNLIKQLFFDKEMVDAIKSSNANSEMLYIQLMSGKITMKEYIAAS
jgi:hypothetical protein